MNKILVTDPIHPTAIAFLEKEGFELDVGSKLSTDELIERISDCSAVICRTSTKIPREVMEVAPNLKCVGIHATGWDHVDVTAASERKIAVLGYPADSDAPLAEQNNGSFIPVAEYVLMTMLVVAKKLIEANASMKSGDWNKYSLSGTELYGKTLGIVGLGRIGSLVAERAVAFGMNVIAYHPRISPVEAEARHATLVTLEQLCAESDFITLHIPKKEENVGLINQQLFSLMSKRPVLFNTARAAVIDEEALMHALKNDLLKAAVIDVYDRAPDGVNWELAQHPKVIATPHIAGVTDESLYRVSNHVARLVTDYLKYGKIKGLINDISE